jgi:molybdopterin synthase sulfur carrier subunit
MPVKVQIPAPLRSLTAGAAEVEVDASNIEGVIDGLEAKYRGIRSRLCDEQGRLRSYVRVFVNGEDTRALGDAKAAVRSGDTVSIVPAIAGGALRR